MYHKAITSTRDEQSFSTSQAWIAHYGHFLNKNGDCCVSFQQWCDVVFLSIITKLPVQNGANISPISEGEQGRPIPGFHGTRRPVVEVSLLIRHRGVVLPSLGDHGHDSLRIWANRFYLKWKMFFLVCYTFQEGAKAKVNSVLQKKAQVNTVLQKSKG